MIGLKILETTQEINIIPFIVISFSVICIFVVFAAFKGVIKGVSPDPKIALIGCIVGTLVGILCFCFAPSSFKYETIHKATVSDEVSYNEFTEKYEIISIDDEIYKIKEKREEKGLFKWME